MATRVNMVVLVAGKRGTGKTTMIKKEIIKKTKLKSLVVDTFDSPSWREIPALTAEMLPRWKKNNYRYFDSNTSAVMANIEKSVYNSLIVFEDATKYVGSKLTDDVKKFVLDSKQKNLDLVFVFHSLASIPSDLVRIADALVLGKTQDSAKNTTVKSKFGIEPQVLEALPKIREEKSPYYFKTFQLG